MYSNYLVINSRDRLPSTANEDGFFTLHRPLEKIKGLELIHFTMPNTFYNVTVLNNNLTYDNGGGPTTVTVPVGNYQNSELLSRINNLLSGSGISCSFDINTMRVTFSSAGNFQLLFGTGLAQVNSLLGFAKANTVSALSVTGDDIMNVGLPTHIYIFCYELGNYYNSVNSNQLASFVVPILANRGEYITYNENGVFPQCVPTHTKTINQLRITLRDHEGKLMETNGSNYTMIFKIIH